MSKKLIRIEEIQLTLEENENILSDKISKILGIEKTQIINFELVKKALDSRKKNNILVVYSINLDIGENEKFFEKKHNFKTQDNIKRHKVRLIEPFEYKIPQINKDKIKTRPVVIGSGPSGLLAGMYLALAGANPIIIERGSSVEKRVVQVHNFFTKRELDINSNVQFGEGGAGTFSDGKLYTLVNDPRSKFIFEEFVKAGAPSEIIYSARPHIGTDRLRGVVRNMRKKIIELGGEFMFDTLVTDLKLENDKIIGVEINNSKIIKTDDVILGIGHSARDTCEMLYNRGLKITQKPFAIGVRIEHPRELINASQFGESCTKYELPTASYKLVSHSESERSVYSFCMCPGGFVVNASSEENMLCINGMSEYAQNSINSNSALLVNVFPADFKSDNPLAGIEFQRYWENKAFIAGGSNYNAPAQLVGDFLKDRSSSEIGKIQTTFKPGLTFTDLKTCLPDFVYNALKVSLPELDKKIKGFASEDAILIGLEARSSAVVRFFRDENYESNLKGLYPTGEGAGYAGGITSSAIDGLIVAENMIKKYL